MGFLHIIPNDFAPKNFGSKFAKFGEKSTPIFRKIGSQNGILCLKKVPFWKPIFRNVGVDFSPNLGNFEPKFFVAKSFGIMCKKPIGIGLEPPGSA